MPSVIVADGLTRRFGHFTAVDNVNLEIEKGDISGPRPERFRQDNPHSHAVRTAAPERGRATVMGHDTYHESELVKQSIGYMSQKFSLYTDLTVMENLRFYARVYGIPRHERTQRIDDVISIVGIGEYRKRLASELSGGWKQRLALACALVHRPA